jgi:hypothetical protein
MLPDKLAQVTSLPGLIAEPTGARSMSFVGTHEYLAPEIIKVDKPTPNFASGFCCHLLKRQ